MAWALIRRILGNEPSSWGLMEVMYFIADSFIIYVSRGRIFLTQIHFMYIFKDDGWLHHVLSRQLIHKLTCIFVLGSVIASKVENRI